MGTFLGSIWTILRPSIFVITIYIVFTFGFKQKDAITNDQLPYIAYLLTGYIPWIFFSETVSATSNVLIQNRNFINRPGFKAIYLPISKTLSALFIHSIFICLMLFILIINETLSIKYLLQFPLVVFLFYLFVLGISLIVCSIRVFLKDISEVMRLLASTTKAKKMLKWNPFYCGRKGFLKGLKETTDWFMNSKNLTLYKSDIYNI